MKEKQLHGEELTKEDYAILSLTPLMSGSMQMKDKIREAIILAKRNTDLTAEKQQQCYIHWQINFWIMQIWTK